MRELFEKLKGLNFEVGAKVIRSEMPELKEIMNVDSKIYDIDFISSDGDYFSYTTSGVKVEDDEPILDLENGYWALMLDGNHYTHA